MHDSTSSAVDSALQGWADRLRGRIDIPVLVRWKGGVGLKLGHFESPRVTIDVRDAKGTAALVAASLGGLGEAYVEGHLDVGGTAHDIVEIAHRLAETEAEASPGLVGRFVSRIAEGARHSKAQDREAIEFHYDVSNDFYAAWLDPRMLYSCAYFENGDETLAEAQLKKLDHILTKLRLRPGQRLLDIGCGWGALVLRAAEKFGARCVGITLSQNQFELASERVRAAGLADRVEIRLQDYREVDGSFDRISSVGMCEHVGLKNLDTYFRVIHERLAPDGWALNHNITSTDVDNGKTSLSGGRFIDSYVFPHGELPHISTVLDAMQRSGLEPVDAEGLRRHYARTLELWSDNYEARSEQLRELVDDRHWRIWRVYLVGCQWAFENDECSVFQVLCQRAGQSARRTLPWSRRWQYEAAPG